MNSALFRLPGIGLLLLTPLCGDAGDDLLRVETTLKMETFSLRNQNLQQGKKRENKLELEPLARVRVSVRETSPLYGIVEFEVKEKTTRETGEPEQHKTRLELNQGYLGARVDAIDTELRLGRWLYRDEREWLFDENLDGLLARWKAGKWRADVLGGRVNYWQRDLLDRTSRNEDNAAAAAAFLWYRLDRDWQVGVYSLVSDNAEDANTRQIYAGLRSHADPDSGLRHWGEISLMSGQRDGERSQGIALDVGGTWIAPSALRPRLTLGYALGSRHYRQTGLHSNEATFGGNSKFNIYGTTLAPELTNLQVITAGAGFDLTPDATLDLIYHDYRQRRLAALADNNTELKSRDDRQTHSRLGSSLDLVWGLQATDSVKTELIMGMFMPSSRFRTSKAADAPRSAPAWSVGFEVEWRF